MCVSGGGGGRARYEGNISHIAEVQVNIILIFQLVRFSTIKKYKFSSANKRILDT